MRRFLLHPATAMGIGLLFFPLAKLVTIPNYVFNFLTTLVHEIGHALFAWVMGMPSIPTVSPAGGGVTVWSNPLWFLAVAIWAGIGYLAWMNRENKRVWIPIAVAGVIYPLLAFTKMRQLLPTAGGILLEIGGAGVCFFVAMAGNLQRPFERPLYALWGWWMLLNRGTETVLMLTDKSYWSARKVIDSGLAAGLTSDLEVMRMKLGWSPNAVLFPVLLLCILVLPVSIGLAWWKHASDRPVA